MVSGEETMSAWINTKRAPFSESLVLKELPREVTSSSRPLLVAVKAVSLNPVDQKMGRRGHAVAHRQAARGADFSGVVVEGSRDGFAVGDEVMGMLTVPEGIRTGKGALAQYISVRPADPLVKKPALISFAEAAAAPLTLQTANTFFRLAKPERGQRIFVNGASGAVGLFAVQIAKSSGLYVVASCSARTRSFVESLRPDEIVDYEEQPLPSHLPQAYPASSDKAFDYVFDTIGIPELYGASSGFVKPRSGSFWDIAAGKFTDASGMLRLLPVLLPRFIQPAWLGGVRTRYRFFNGEISRDNLEEVVELLSNGTVKVKIDSKYPFERAVEAFERLKSHRAIGKVIVEM